MSKQMMEDKLTRKKPWNRASLAVYSVSSQGEKPNMHICTYVSAVSMKPKRMMVAIYHGTQTLRNVERSENFVLQLLASHQYRLVDLLGKKSGLQMDKMLPLQKRNLLHEWKGFHILNECLAAMLLKPVANMEAGDHRMYLCDVIAHKNLANGLPLTLPYFMKKESYVPELSAADLDRIVEMAWEDRTPFEALEIQFGLKEAEVIEIMRRYMKPSSFRMWRKRMQGRSTKHMALRSQDVQRFKCSRQRAISSNKISKR